MTKLTLMNKYNYINFEVNESRISEHSNIEYVIVDKNYDACFIDEIVVGEDKVHNFSVALVILKSDEEIENIITDRKAKRKEELGVEWENYRRSKYPHIGEFADSYLKHTKFAVNDQMNAYLNKCQMVKTLIPKFTDIESGNIDVSYDAYLKDMYDEWLTVK